MASEGYGLQQCPPFAATLGAARRLHRANAWCYGMIARQQWFRQETAENTASCLVSVRFNSAGTTRMDSFRLRSGATRSRRSSSPAPLAQGIHSICCQDELPVAGHPQVQVQLFVSFEINSIVPDTSRSTAVAEHGHVPSSLTGKPVSGQTQI